jgi:hypothetical protein
LKSPREEMQKIIKDAKNLGVKVHKIVPAPSKSSRNNTNVQTGKSQLFESDGTSVGLELNSQDT